MSQIKDQHLIIGIGEILWDLLPSGRQLGGAPTNFALHAQALGGNGIVVSAVGADEDGQDIIQHLKKLNMNTDYIMVDPKLPTGCVTVQLDKNGIPEYTIHEDVAWDFIASGDKLFELAGRAQAVCYGTLAQRSMVSRNTVQDFLKHTNRHCLKIFDINLRQSYFDIQIIEQMLMLSDVLKLNESELRQIAELLDVSGTESNILEKLLEKYQYTLIALTKGSWGSVLVTETGRTEHPGIPIKAVDTVGAGDAFTAALTFGLLENKPLRQINDHANRVAAYVCSQAGATPKIPDELMEY